MKILIISAEVWRNDTNGGNVLSNIFDGFDAEYAQIYCNPGVPSNNICKKYYQMTDSMILGNVFKNKTIGKVLDFKNFPIGTSQNQPAEEENKKFYRFFRKHSFQIFHIGKELLWKFSGWKNDSLKDFIEEFNPDIIFAPCYGSHFMLSLDRYTADLTNKPIISYISDDHYSLRQFRFSPLFWINRVVLRRNLRRTFKYYDLTYTMTDEQLQECQKAFHSNMQILRKGIDIAKISHKEEINDPIKLIFAGGIYCGRWKSLIVVAKALQKINRNGIRMVLHIYTGNRLLNRQLSILNDGNHSIVHGLITQIELQEKYRQSDIALHVESFDLKYRLLTRTSFSTKIVDCLASGAAVMAICWANHAGFAYLRREDAAICVGNKQTIYDTLLKIVNNPEILKEYAEKAYHCSEKNHQNTVVRRQIIADFENIIRGNK